ncbi:NAD(P)/FAD-dependent oxidoreductase [Frateuria hangzhouensis]|uniref:NAD(P)/FAD-dependent oxidoreductase n=1 Tax=Frateuria hangzhouensis TaxID=2995589 RepID=UPI002260E41D|nr:FAD-dependent oxidoreductase [Frateuria sp. STR12]MCX7514509.1 FAD-dependent oxidoreductase [Frateuria sp. STR12]
MEHAYDYLIVGGGMAGDAAAKAIRAADATAFIGLVGAETSPPYQRPPLSKALWKGDTALDSVDLGTAATGAVLHLGRRVTSLDPAARRVRDERGDSYGYRRLLLATGATPRRLPFAAGDRLIHYRTVDDYRRLRRYAVAGAHVAVIGGGFIGSELAASLAGVGCKVSMLFPGESIGSGRYPPTLAAFLDDYYRGRGVDLLAGVKVVDGRADDTGVELVLSDGRHLRVDAAVAGLGVTPDTALAEHAGLAVADGVVVDAQLRTSDPDIWAAGDLANFFNPSLGRRLRVEHENAAVEMGAHAGRAMAGAGGDYTTLPYFYSDLFDLGYEAVGLLDARLQVVEDWSEPHRKGVVYYLEGGRVRGVLLWNVWDQVDAARALIAQPGPFDAASLRGRIPHDG